MSQADRTRNDVVDRKRETNREVAERKARVPRHEQNALTFLNLDPDFKYRMVNDLPGRINSFIMAGWEIVEGDILDTYSGKGREAESQRSSQVWRTVNKRHGAPCTDAVLMRIPLDIFNEDYAARQLEIDEAEKALDPEGIIRQAQAMGGLSSIHKRQLSNSIKKR